MTLEALGNLGDFIGGLAVIATLLYLAVQVRQNSKLLRATALATTSEALISFNNLLASDPAVARVLQLGLEEFAALSDTERRQFINMLRSLFTAYQHAFQQYEDRLIDREVWHQHRRAAAAALALPHVAAWWEHRKEIFGPSFVRAIEASPPVSPGTLAGDVIAAMEAKAPRPPTVS